MGEEARQRQIQAEDTRRKRMEKMKQEEENHRRMMEEQTVTKQQPLRPAPKLVRRDSFKALNHTVKGSESQKVDNVNTGYVKEKRNFWMKRSASTDKLNGRHEMSPGPQRRKRLGDWMRSEQTPEPCSRPGSSLGQA